MSYSLLTLKLRRLKNKNSMPFTKGHKINVGRPVSIETRRKIGASNSVSVKKFYDRGGTTWNVGVPNLAAAENYKGSGNPMFGKKPWNKGLKGFRAGEVHHNWRGGVTPFMLQIRASFEYKLWRTRVFERDDYTCVECKDNNGGNLNADHIKPFALIISLNGISTYEQAQSCKALWDITNGRTLCTTCHVKTDTWGQKTTNLIKQLKT